MKPAPPFAASGPKPKPSRYDGFWPAVLIVLAGAAAYANSFSGPFIFDDWPSIAENPTIRHLWSALAPRSTGIGGAIGRPLINFSFAVNYAVGGLRVWGYHATNLAIHILAGLTLFGIVRRTLTSRLATRRSEISNLRFEISEATSLAFAVAVIWTVHPLQTESVTSIVQRTESLMGLFYLLTLYCFIRGAEKGSQESGVRSQEKRSGFRHLASNLWPLASVCCCLLGMASKEVMVSAPLIVLLYDRTFLAGTFREAWRRRRGWYFGLFSTWLLLGYLVVHMGGRRAEGAGFGLNVTPWTYALTQCRAIVHYLELAVWPHPLVFDYGTGLVQHFAAVAPQALVLTLLVAGTIFMLRYRPVLGFLGAWFFAILAPSSSVVPLVAQTMAEHRMYLPLAAVVVLIVWGLHRLLGGRSFPVLLALAAAFGWLTSQRNETYRTEERIWRDTVAKCPDSERAHYGLGAALTRAGQTAASVAEYEEALRLKPDYAEAHSNLANVLKAEGRTAEAIVHYEEAVELKPNLAEAHNNLGIALKAEGRTAEAIAQYEEAVRLKPDYAEAHNNLGIVLSAEGRTAEAVAQYEEAVRLKPDLAEAHNNLGIALIAEGRIAEAIAEYEEALRFRPDYPEAHNDLGSALKAEGRTAEAIAHYEEAVRLKPDLAEAHNGLGSALKAEGHTAEAIAQYDEAVRLKPDYAEARNNLGNALSAEGRPDEAITQYEEAVRLRPDLASIHFNLALALLNIPGRTNEAVTHLEAVLRLQPDNDQAREILARIAASGP